MCKIAIVYHSFSGNTEEVAELIESALVNQGISPVFHRIGIDDVRDYTDCDLLFLGTFTWEKGAVPEEIEDFLYDTDLPENIAIFGTGDTQFGGDELFCMATQKVAIYTKSTYIPLKIEQSPRGSQEDRVLSWVNQIISSCKKKGKI